MEQKMMRLMKNMTNAELLDKIEYEGTEYFFLDYISLDSIKNETLRDAVEELRMAWGDILAFISDLEELERSIDDKD